MSFFKKFKITINLRGGQTIKFKCNKFEIKKNNNELTSYSAEDVDNATSEDKLFYVRLDAIDHIEIKRNWLLW